MILGGHAFNRVVLESVQAASMAHFTHAYTCSSIDKEVLLFRYRYLSISAKGRWRSERRSGIAKAADQPCQLQRKRSDLPRPVGSFHRSPRGGVENLWRVYQD